MLIRADVGFKVRHRNALVSMLALLGAVVSSPSRADQTNSQPISQVLYSGTADYLFFIGTGGWVATGCNAYYVQVLPNLLGQGQDHGNRPRRVCIWKECSVSRYLRFTGRIL